MSENVLDQARSLFFAEAREMCEQIEASLLKLEEDPADRETLNALFRAAHTIKGSAGMFGLAPVVGFTHKVESVLDRLREGSCLLDINLTSLLFECGDHIRALLGHCESGGDDGSDDDDDGGAGGAGPPPGWAAAGEPFVCLDLNGGPSTAWGAGGRRFPLGTRARTLSVRDAWPM
jgi:chemotaxis protein histidine kinase CheA